jgi:hypothetical protein
MDSPRIVGPFTIAQALSLLVAVVSLAIWFALGRRPAETEPAGAADVETASDLGDAGGGPAQSGSGEQRGV